MTAVPRRRRCAFGGVGQAPDLDRVLFRASADAHICSDRGSRGGWADVGCLADHLFGQWRASIVPSVAEYGSGPVGRRPGTLAAGQATHFRIDNLKGPAITYGPGYSIQECVGVSGHLRPSVRQGRPECE